MPFAHEMSSREFLNSPAPFPGMFPGPAFEFFPPLPGPFSTLSRDFPGVSEKIVRVFPGSFPAPAYSKHLSALCLAFAVPMKVHQERGLGGVTLDLDSRCFVAASGVGAQG